MKGEMKKVAFFFGAGAEGEGNFNVRMGFEYLKSSLYAADILNGFDKALSTFFENKYYFGDMYKYRTDRLNVDTLVLRNFIAQKAANNQEFFDKHMEMILAILQDEDIRYVCRQLEIDDSHKHTAAGALEEPIKNLKKELKEILIGEKEKYSDISSQILKEIFQEQAAEKYAAGDYMLGKLDKHGQRIDIAKCRCTARFI